jgi:ribosomal protein S18 acetylase RimI-like enzyme
VTMVELVPIRETDLNVRRDNPVALAFWRSVGFELALYQLRQYVEPTTKAGPG